MNLPVFDLHCDTALELLDNHCRPVERLRKRQGHIDLERGGKLAGYAQLFAFYHARHGSHGSVFAGDDFPRHAGEPPAGAGGKPGQNRPG